MSNDTDQVNSSIVRCKRFPGHALQSALEGKRIVNDLYEIYEVGQNVFKEDEWRILAPRQMSLMAKLKKNPTVDQFLTVRVGFNTGANSIFIRDISDIPSNEKKVYIPYLQDREMVKYIVPE